MHWEKMQEQQRTEANKNDIEAIRKKQEADRRKKKELEARQDREKTKQTLEIEEFQVRRRSLAEAWENKSNNNQEVAMTVKTTELSSTKTTKVLAKKSPRKSPLKKTVSLSYSRNSTEYITLDLINGFYRYTPLILTWQCFGIS